MSRGGFLRNLALLAVGLGIGVGPLPRPDGPGGAGPSSGPSRTRPGCPSTPSHSVKRRA